MRIQEANRIQSILSLFYVLVLILSTCWKTEAVKDNNPIPVVLILIGSTVIAGLQTPLEVSVFDLVLHFVALFILCARCRIIRRRGFVLLILLLVGEISTVCSEESSSDGRVAFALTSLFSLLTGLFLSISLTASTESFASVGDDEDYPYLATFFALVTVHNVFYYAFSFWKVSLHLQQYSLLAVRNMILFLMVAPFFSETEVCV